MLNAPKFSDMRASVLNRVKGCLIGGAIGDALGYPVEFLSEEEIRNQYGEKGIEKFKLTNGKALISDDTQLTLFTAAGCLACDTNNLLTGKGVAPHTFMSKVYKDWVVTQTMTIKEYEQGERNACTWLNTVDELYARRAPGITCLRELCKDEQGSIYQPINDSKGCGGVMRVAPLPLFFIYSDRVAVAKEAAEVAALSHGHALGYMPAAVLSQIISLCAFPYDNDMSLKDIVIEASEVVKSIFGSGANVDILLKLIDKAIRLSENDKSDIDNIHELGEGWVAEETLAIAIYCSLKYHDDFSKAIRVAVNHKGDSDSTGSVTGNILGAYLGLDNIDSSWFDKLELLDVIEKISEDIVVAISDPAGSRLSDDRWLKRYKMN